MRSASVERLAHSVLDGQAAVVTGAARGIGRVIALTLAEAGADVLACARHLEDLEPVTKEIKALGRKGVPFALDLSDTPRVPLMAEAAEAAFGKIDVLVNNSGTGGPSAPLWEIAADEWQHTLDVNLTGAFLCSRAVLPSMVARRSGSIVFIGSVTGKRPLLHRAPYAASKLGIVGLCRTLALDAGHFGVRANVVSPGFVAGERIDWVIGRQAEAQERTAHAVRADLELQAALGRLVTPREVADTVVFLASDAARGITGVDVNVAAGAVMD